ncbi:MAG: TRAP transporter large permease subunit, partial [Clostridiaceae bacterium]|nr:TRAP transporter large permease subunit [Clostridiaceae bacterium]
VSRIQFGVFHSLNCLIGTCTPPVGTGLMIMTSLTKQKFSSVVRAFMPYFIPLIICLLAVTFIPFLSTWLPGLF